MVCVSRSENVHKQLFCLTKKDSRADAHFLGNFVVSLYCFWFYFFLCFFPLSCKTQECLHYNEAPLQIGRVGENLINVNKAIRLSPSRRNMANLSHSFCSSVNHCVTPQTFICIFSARARRQTQSWTQRSVCCAFCLPTTHCKLPVNTQTLLRGILEGNVHLLCRNTQKVHFKLIWNLKKMTHRLPQTSLLFLVCRGDYTCLVFVETIVWKEKSDSNQSCQKC